MLQCKEFAPTAPKAVAAVVADGLARGGAIRAIGLFIRLIRVPQSSPGASAVQPEADDLGLEHAETLPARARV